MRPATIMTMALGATMLLPLRSAFAGADLLVGVLEDVPAAAAGDQPPRVRLAFRYTDAGGWEAYPHDCLSPDCLSRIVAKYPRRVHWSVGLAGLTLGQLSARTPARFHSDQEIGLQDIVGKAAPPFVGRPSLEYAGAVGEPVRRPLLVTSGRRNPQRSRGLWKEGAPDPADLDRAWPVFRHLVPLIDECSAPAPPSTDAEAQADAAAPATKPSEAAAPAGRHPRRLDLEIPVAWVANNGDALLRVAVRRDLYTECDGPRAYPRQLWMYRQASGKIQALPGQLSDDGADLIAPLEFSDLLRDGHEQVLFRAAGHERGGYVLYYDRFRRSVAYLWAFH